MKEKICIFDLFNEGHHWFYNYNLIKGIEEYEITYITSNLTEEQKCELQKNNIIVKEFRVASKKFQQIGIIKELFDCILYCKKNNIHKIINVYFDRYILAYSILKLIIKKYRIEFKNTLHWFPNNKIKIFLLKLSKPEGEIIVHTSNVKNKLNNIGISNVKVINYPVKEKCKLSKEICQKDIGIDSDRVNILYFGGTRYDKGVDILLNSLVNIKSLEKLRIIIAGREETFGKEFIMNKLSKLHNLDYRIELKYISEERMNKYFISSDFIVLPYRNIFNGESGIITESLNNGIPVIAPDIIHFKEKVGNAGVLYKCEDTYELAKAIEYSINNIEKLTSISQKKSDIFRKNNSIENFQNEYKKMLVNKKRGNL